VVDSFSVDVFGPHPPDTELGGTDDMEAYGVSQEAGRTTVEVTRRLSTGDSRDKPIPSSGDVSFIWAIGQGDDWETIHTRAGYGTIHMSTGEVESTGIPAPVLVHLVALSISFLLMFAATFVPRTMKRTVKSWRPTHIAMELAGVIVGVIGAAVAFWMVQATGAGHLRVIHSWFAMITIVLLIATPIIGQMFLKMKNGKKQLRLAHHWVGRVALGLMAWTILLGFFQAGLL
jgi:hypothetical protein